MNEAWKDIEGYEGSYQVSNKGRVKSLKRKIPFKKSYRTINEKIMSSSLSRGYPCVILRTHKNPKCHYIHRLVAKEFVPNPKNKPEVNHKDGNRENNKAGNLEWVTHKENIRHAFNTGLVDTTKACKGEDHGQTPFCENDIHQIRSIYEQGFFTVTEIANSYNVSRPSIYQILNRESWTHI